MLKARQRTIKVSPTYGLFSARAYDRLWTWNFFAYTAIKRILDTIFAVVLLILGMPLFIITAIAIKLDSPGPIFFRQERVGKDGKIFEIFKFRSMASDNNMLDLSCGDKYTRVGKFIRRTSIDELPQLLNVLMGQMSFVGPRPWVVDYWKNMTMEQRERARVLPGITGLAQVKGRNGISVFKKIEWDLTYVKNYCLWQDIKIVILTVATIFVGDSVDAGKEGMHDDIRDLSSR